MSRDRLSEERLREMLAAFGQDTFAGFTRTTELRVPLAKALITELLELRSEAKGVPEGWVVVPKEPTEAMIEAFMVECEHQHVALDEFSEPISPAKMYAAMIAAAPASPDTQTQENDR